MAAALDVFGDELGDSVAELERAGGVVGVVAIRNDPRADPRNDEEPNDPYSAPGMLLQF